MDEFCKLASESEHQDIQHHGHSIRQIVSSVLSCVNPEPRFQDSEYYQFIQRLFKDDLHSLRDDVSVLTFNYDPYLEFLLLRAYDERQRVRGKDPNTPGHFDARNAINSGFLKMGNRSWLEMEGFCLLKLHGTIALPTRENRPYSSQDLFTTQDAVLDKVFSPLAPPAIAFPWELFDDKLRMRTDCFEHQPAFNEHFRGTWERAKREVASASKISFVGISMHHYLEHGLKFLFRDIKDEVQLVVANTDSTESGFLKVPKVWTSAAKIVSTIKRIAPALPLVTYYTEEASLKPSKFAGGIHSSALTVRASFEEFIQKEMNPIDQFLHDDVPRSIKVAKMWSAEPS